MQGTKKREYCNQHAEPGSRSSVSARSEGGGSGSGRRGGGVTRLIDVDAPVRQTATTKRAQARQAGAATTAVPVAVKEERGRDEGVGYVSLA